MINIQHIKAHLPSKNCQLTFMIRKKQRNLIQKKQSKIKLTQDYVDIDINSVIQLGQFTNYPQPVQLNVIAITQTDKICVGSAEISLKQVFNSKQFILQGIIDQDGYIICSIIKDNKIGKSTRSLQQNSNKQQIQKISASRGFIKYKNSSSSSSINDNQQSIESRSGSSSPFKKNKVPYNMAIKTDQYHTLLDQIYHQILEEQLYNQRIWNKIQENQIFQLRYKQRIEALIGNNIL